MRCNNNSSPSGGTTRVNSHYLSRKKTIGRRCGESGGSGEKGEINFTAKIKTDKIKSGARRNDKLAPKP